MARARRRYLPSNVVIQESPMKAGIDSLTSLVLDLANKELDRKSEEKRYEMALLVDKYRDVSSETRTIKGNYDLAKRSYAAMFGRDLENDPEYSSGREEVATDITGMYKSEIDDQLEMAKLLKDATYKKSQDIAIMQGISSSLNLASPEYGKSATEYGPLDFTGDVLVPQFTGAEGEELKRLVGLFEDYKKTNPQLFSERRMEALNLLSAKARTEAGIITEKDFESKVGFIQNTLAQSNFMRDMGALNMQLQSGAIRESELVEKAVNLYPVEGGYSLGSTLSPELGIVKKGADMEPYYNEIANTYHLFSSFIEGTGVNAMGLKRFTNKMKRIYNSPSLKANEGGRANFRQYLLDNLNFDVTKPDQFIFPRYSDTGKMQDISVEDITLEQSIEGSFKSMYPGDITEANLDLFFGDKKIQEEIRGLYKETYPDMKPGKIKTSVRGVYYSLLKGVKKKGKKDVVALRKKLVESNYPIVDVTADTGFTSVLAEGKARIRLAEPMAEKFLEAKEILKNKGIDLQIGDSFVHYSVKEKQYNEWLAGGEKGPIVASPDKSFHTVGYAFDLEQTDEMKSSEVASVMESLGLVRSETEWWHWSLEEI